jgi:hypothetical protein
VTREARWAARVLGCLLPSRDVEVVVGDLQEEYGHRLRTGAGTHAMAWFWGQVFRSIPPLMWTSIRRDGVLTTLGLAATACLLQAALEFVSRSGIVSLTGLMLLGYGANRLRSGVVLLKGTFPPSNQLFVLLFAPCAVLIGGALSLRRHARE